MDKKLTENCKMCNCKNVNRKIGKYIRGKMEQWQM